MDEVVRFALVRKEVRISECIEEVAGGACTIIGIKRDLLSTEPCWELSESIGVTTRAVRSEEPVSVISSAYNGSEAGGHIISIVDFSDSTMSFSSQGNMSDSVESGVTE